MPKGGRSLPRRVKQKIAQWYADREAFAAGEDAEREHFAKIATAKAKSRLLKYTCSVCHQIIRVAGESLVAECRAGKFDHWDNPGTFNLALDEAA